MAQTLESFKMATGFYDEAAILIAAGTDERNARFAAIFGDEQGANEISPEWQVLLDEARAFNVALHAQIETASDAAIVTELSKPVWSWPTLVSLRAARMWRDEDCMRYELTGRGLDLWRAGSFVEPTTYHDQVGLDQPF
jgi:hypothetical protein